jgi:hypothetical protein
MRYIYSDYNDLIHPDDYLLDATLLEKIIKANDHIKLNKPQIEILAKVRTRSNQTRESLNRIQTALIQCQHTEWLQQIRKINNTSNIHSIDFAKLKITDLYDYYICPEDVYLDRHGERPVIGPVFPDYRNGKLAGICIRNLSAEKEYVSDVKYTFSNFGWYIYGYDNYHPEDQVYITEGVFDAIALRAYGHNAIAIGCSNPSPMQLAMLLHKFKNLKICFDNDLAGYVGSLKCSLMLNIPIHTTIGYKDIAQCWEAEAKLELAELSTKDLKILISEYPKQENNGGRDLRYNL